VAPTPKFLDQFPPTAQALLRAARRMLIREGVEGLSLGRIAEEAGDHKSSVRYYFGDKSGLVKQLMDYLIHDATMELLEESEALPAGPSRLHAYVMRVARMISTPDSRVFFDVLPLMLRDQKLREALASYYDWIREINMRCFGATPTEANRRDLEELAAIFVAVVDGLAIQKEVASDNFITERVLKRLESIMRRELEDLVGIDEPQRRPDAQPAQSKGVSQTQAPDF
jgi:AcrR family transcriptional regulator